MEKVGIERETRLDGGARLIQSAKPRECAAQNKMRMRKIAVGLDRLSEPGDRLLVPAKAVLRRARTIIQI